MIARILRPICLLSLLAILVACNGPDETEPPPSPETVSTTGGEAPEQTADPGSTRDACELSVGWDPWAPYHFMGPDGTVQGMDIELVSTLADQVDCELEFVQGNWASLLKLIRLGELDVLLGATRTEAREAFARFSSPYRDEVFSLYVRPGEVEQHPGETLRDLLSNDFRLGVTQGYIYSDPVTQLQMAAEFSDQFFEATVGEQHFARLTEHTIDGFLEDPFVVAAITRRRGWENRVNAHPMTFSSSPVRMMFSRESVAADTVTALDDALQGFRDEGGYQALQKRYLGME